MDGKGLCWRFLLFSGSHAFLLFSGSHAGIGPGRVREWGLSAYALDEGVDDLTERGVGALADDEDAHEQNEYVEEVRRVQNQPTNQLKTDMPPKRLSSSSDKPSPVGAEPGRPAHSKTRRTVPPNRKKSNKINCRGF